MKKLHRFQRLYGSLSNDLPKGAALAFDKQQLEDWARRQNQVPLPLSFHIFETLSSTNQTLWKFIDQGAIPGTVVIATQQSAGRGQWGRTWESEAGGLYLSVALEPNLSAENSLQLTLCSAWGIATALRSYDVPVFLKWPNDLFLSGRKLGGILTETRVQQGKITKAVVGVGINWTNSVPDTGINLQSFWVHDQLKPSITSLEMLAKITLQGLLSGYEQAFQKGIETLLPSYMELLMSRGRPVVVDGKPGVISGVTSSGELRVRLHSADASEIYLKPGTINLGHEC